MRTACLSPQRPAAAQEKREQVQVTVKSVMSRVRQTAGLIGWTGSQGRRRLRRPGRAPRKPIRRSRYDLCRRARRRAVFLDANVFIHHFEPNAAFGVVSTEFLERIENQEISGVAATFHIVSDK